MGVSLVAEHFLSRYKIVKKKHSFRQGIKILAA